MAGLSPEAAQFVLMAVGAVLGLCSGLVIMNLQEVRRTQRAQGEELGEELSHLRREAARLEAALPEKYVLRDDFVRQMVSVDKKLDDIGREVCSLSKSMAALVGEKVYGSSAIT